MEHILLVVASKSVPSWVVDPSWLVGLLGVPYRVSAGTCSVVEDTPLRLGAGSPAGLVTI